MSHQLRKQMKPQSKFNWLRPKTSFMYSGCFLMRYISIVLCFFRHIREATHDTRGKRSRPTRVLASRKKWKVCFYRVSALTKNLHTHSFWCKSCVSNNLGLWQRQPSWHKWAVNRFLSGGTLLTSVDVLVHTCSSPPMISVCSLAVAYLKLYLSARSDSQGLSRENGLLVCDQVWRIIWLLL